MARYGGNFATAPEDPAYYDAIAEGSGYGIAGNIAEGAVAGVAAPLLLRNKRKAEAQSSKDKQEMALALYDAAISAGSPEPEARLVAKQYLTTGETSLSALLQSIRKGKGEADLNTAKIGTEQAQAGSFNATTDKTIAETAEIPATAEAERGYKDAQGKAALSTANAANVTAGAAKTNALGNLRKNAADAMKTTTEDYMLRFSNADKNQDNKIDKKEMAKLVESEYDRVKSEKADWDSADEDMRAAMRASDDFVDFSKMSAEKDFYEEAKRRAIKIASLKSSIIRDMPDIIGQVSPIGSGADPDSLGGGPAIDTAGGGESDPDTDGALAEIGRFAGQKPTDPDGLIAYLKGKYPNMDEAKIRQQLAL